MIIQTHSDKNTIADIFYSTLKNSSAKYLKDIVKCTAITFNSMKMSLIKKIVFLFFKLKIINITET